MVSTCVYAIAPPIKQISFRISEKQRTVVLITTATRNRIPNFLRPISKKSKTSFSPLFAWLENVNNGAILGKVLRYFLEKSSLWCIPIRLKWIPWKSKHYRTNKPNSCCPILLHYWANLNVHLMTTMLWWSSSLYDACFMTAYVVVPAYNSAFIAPRKISSLLLHILHKLLTLRPTHTSLSF